MNSNRNGHLSPQQIRDHVVLTFGRITTHGLVKIQRSVRKATEAAERASRDFALLSEDYFDLDTHAIEVAWANHVPFTYLGPHYFTDADMAEEVRRLEGIFTDEGVGLLDQAQAKLDAIPA